MTRHAVLTGDIIGSSSLDRTELDRVIATLAEGAAAISGWQEDLRTGFSRRGGDGWQMVLDRARLAFRAALYMQALLRRMGRQYATRIALATGAGPLPDRALADPNSGHGPVFTASGRLLEAMPARMRMAHAAGGAEAAALDLADHILDGWTQAQGRAACEALVPDNSTRADIAARLGVSRQAVNRALWSAGWPAIPDALALLEADR